MEQLKKQKDGWELTKSENSEHDKEGEKARRKNFKIKED